MKKSIFQLFCLTSIVYALQGLEDLSSTPVFFYLKENLHLNESTIMYVGALTGLAWLIKPIFGHWIDNYFSKKQWILFSALGSLGICLTLGLAPIFSLIPLIILLSLSNFNTAVRDVASDGEMCIQGKKHNITGKIQSVNWVTITLASILTGIGGGYIAEHFSYQTSFLILIPFYLLLLWITKNYPEQISRKKSISLLVTLKKIFTDKNLLWVSLFIFLFKFSPSFGIPLTFIERDNFHWSKLFIGSLVTLGAVASVIGALLYYKFSKYLNIKRGLIISTIIGATTTIAFLYFTPVSAIVYNIINSVISMFIMLMLLDLMAQKTKKGFEAISFALLCSISNLANTCNNLTGAWLFPVIGLKPLIIFSALTSFLCLLVIKRIRF